MIYIATRSLSGTAEEVGIYMSARRAWEALADDAKEHEEDDPAGFDAVVNVLEMFSRGEYETALATTLDEETGAGIVTVGPQSVRWHEVMEVEMTAEPGTVSEGTLLIQDLLRNFWAAIPDDVKAALFNSEDGDLLRAYSADMLFGQENEDALLEVLGAVLESIAPEGHRFGAHEGDGACFGFWEVEEDEDLDRAMEEQEERVVNAFQGLGRTSDAPPMVPVAWRVPEAQEDFALPGHDAGLAGMMTSPDFLMAAWYVWGVIDYAPSRMVDGIKVSVEDVQGFARAWWTTCQDGPRGPRVHRPSLQDAFRAYLRGEALTPIN